MMALLAEQAVMIGERSDPLNDVATFSSLSPTTNTNSCPFDELLKTIPLSLNAEGHPAFEYDPGHTDTQITSQIQQENVWFDTRIRVLSHYLMVMCFRCPVSGNSSGCPKLARYILPHPSKFDP